MTGQRRRAQRQTMPFADAIKLVPDDLPDGAFWAMAHEFAGLEYGDGFAELAGDIKPPRHIPCARCGRKFRSQGALAQHRRDAHGKPKP